MVKGPASHSDFFCLQFPTKRIIHAVTRIVFQKPCLFKVSSRSSLVSTIVPRTSLVNLAAASVFLICSVKISAGQRSGSANHSGPFKHKLATWRRHSLCSLHLRGSGQCSHVFIGNVVLFLYLANSVSNKLLVDTASTLNPM